MNLVRDRRELHPQFDRKDFAQSIGLGMMVASVANSMPAIFWTLAHVLNDPVAYETCQNKVFEIASKREDGRDWFTFDELDQLIVLQSAFRESLRMYQCLFASRNAVEDFIINPKETKGPKYMVEKGTLVMSVPNVMHHDPMIFEDPEVYKFDRFLDPKAKTPDGKALLSSQLRPFGGGSHSCPGRKFIDYEARALLAMMLLKLDMQLTPQQPEGEKGGGVPEIDFTRQGLGVSPPDRDVSIQFRLRKTTK